MLLYLSASEIRTLQGILECEIDRANHEPDYSETDDANLRSICDKVDEAAK